MKPSFYVVFFLMFFGTAQGQLMDYKINFNQVDDLRSLQIRVYPEFFIAPGERDLTLPANLIADAHYYMGKVADFNAGLSFGSNKGVLLGGCFHLRDHERTVKERFILGESTTGRITTTRYLKVPVMVRSFSGPCADVFIGSQMGPFTAKMDLGWSWSGYRHSQIHVNETRYISGRLNGFHTIKIQGVLQAPIPTEKNYFKGGVYITERGKALGVGGQIAVDYNSRPWRLFTLYAGLTMGYIKVPDNGSAPILSIRIGTTISNK